MGEKRALFWLFRVCDELSEGNPPPRLHALARFLPPSPDACPGSKTFPKEEPGQKEIPTHRDVHKGSGWAEHAYCHLLKCGRLGSEGGKCTFGLH